MIRRLEKRVGRVGILIGAFLLTTLVICVPVGVIGSSNIVWGEPDQYGRMDVPGTKVQHLPSGTVEVRVALIMPGRGNETPNIPLPESLSLRMAPVEGSRQPDITRDVGSTGNAMGGGADAQRRVWKVKIPQDGDYRVTARGNFLGIGVNPQLWFGYGPPLPGPLVPVVAAGLAVIAMLFWIFVRPRIRRRRAAGGLEQREDAFEV